MVVRDELRKMGLHHGTIELGVIEVFDDISEGQRKQLGENLQKCGLELLNDKKQIFIERVNCTIIEMIHYSDELPANNYSDYISGKLNYDYKYISNLFSEIMGITIQQFIIIHKIEKVKELLLYDELNLTEISCKLNYSSVGHLSNQFKKTTGLSPKVFKEIKQKRSEIMENQ
jgi:AraC-like DNA-binding protein